MRYLIASDLHGSKEYGALLMRRFREEKAHKLILLGDYLYQGPRNPLPEGYDSKELYEILNDHCADIIGVHGNCDSDIDEMVLQFPIGEYTRTLRVDGHTWFLTHGHLFDQHSMVNHDRNDILLTGHTHIKVAERCGDFYHINPGSTSLPKDGIRSYALYSEGVFYLKALEDASVLTTLKISE